MSRSARLRALELIAGLRLLKHVEHPGELLDAEAYAALLDFLEE